MKKIAITLILLASVLLTFASNWEQVSGNNIEKSNLVLVQSSATASTLHYTLSGYYFTEIETTRGTAIQVEFNEGAPILLSGAPNLPLYATSLIIPNQANMKVNLISSSFQEYQNVLIAPSKGNLTRDIDPASIPYTFGKQYGTDAFYPGDIATLRDPFIMRDFRGQTVLIQPFQYNPVTRTLRVYYDITLEIVDNGISNINTLNAVAQPQVVSTQFNLIYNRHFINYANNSRSIPLEEDGNMLIICHADFIDAIQPFVDWKIKTGMQVEVVDVATIGNAAAIKTFIADYYTTNGLTFVLLVGDSQQVPSSVVGGNDSDNNYTYIVGNDHYPDVFCGRFSAQTEAHAITQVQRVLDYEQTPISDTSWYRKLIGIASDQGPGDDNEYDYQHIRKIGNEKLIPYTYNYAYEYFDGTQGGNDAPGSPNSSTVATGINSGATIINYTGHGSDNAWSSSGFSSTNVNQLTNAGKLPFIFSVACVNGNFVNGNCFAEAWMRAEDNGQPTGAIATLMSTINQSWNPPMAGQDAMNEILTEAYSDNIKRTFAGISMNGCMLMNDEYGSGGNEMTDTWTVFGDPSLVIRTSIPQNMIVSHPNELHIGESSLTLSCNAEGAKAALTLDGVILGTAIVTSGSAVITFDPLATLSTLDLVVTAYNYIPYMTTIDVIPEMGPFMAIAGTQINDVAGGNGNGLMDYAEDILLTMRLTNVGIEDAFGVTAILSSSSPYIDITSESAIFGDVAVGDTMSVIDAFAFSVANDMPNMALISFTLTSSDQDGNEWISSFLIPGHAARLVFMGYTIDDAAANNNGKLDAGETADILLSVKNSGSADAYQVITQLLSTNPYITVNSDPINYGDMTPGENKSMAFNVTVGGDTPAGYSASFAVNALGNFDLTMSDEFYTIVGQIPVLIINLAEVNSADSMMACLQVLEVGGNVVTAIPETLELYSSVFVLLGTYPDNHALTTSEGDELAAYLLGGGRVYMEGGDTWVYDDATAAHELFHINGLVDGSGDVATVTGDESNFLTGLSFEYNGTNSYIDQIEPKEGAYTLMSNSSPEYVTTVSFENEIYKTVGSSIEFAGLANQEGSTKDNVMAEILTFFSINHVWTAIDESLGQKMEMTAYPNPFNGQVTFTYQLDEKTPVTFDVFDVTGRVVYTTGQQVLNPGTQKLIWDAQNMEPGIYTYRIKAGSLVITDKLIRTN